MLNIERTREIQTEVEFVDDELLLVTDVYLFGLSNANTYAHKLIEILVVCSVSTKCEKNEKKNIPNTNFVDPY